ncbi:hypothetical protein B0H11DRAFT_1701873 [Mycena galericulata]|nr:hypothetical protein B0H11DRAFT_1763668 [Mycena galericulata]KAJ7509979.1 hypothetical protein B0H11DRAFT_1701873 [Mycena galericulata]
MTLSYHTLLVHSDSGGRIQILERLASIHRVGLLHGDFAERNVLLHDGDIRIIDFDQTESGHDCQWKMPMNLHPGEKLPDIEEFGCDQLWEVCRTDLRIWDTGWSSRWFVPRRYAFTCRLSRCINNLISFLILHYSLSLSRTLAHYPLEHGT